MKKFFKNLFLISVPTLVAVVLILELAFRLVIPASDPPVPHFDKTDLMYKFHESNETGLFTIGPLAQQRASWRINNEGWNSKIDYTKNKNKGRIAIVGDSYIEAFQVDVDKKYPALLRTDISDKYDVYSFGISGAPLSQYLHMSRYVADTFDPDIIIFNIVHNDFYESIYSRNPGNAHFLRLRIGNGTIEEIKPQPDYSFMEYSPTKRALNESALIRYLYRNLRIKTLLANISKEEGVFAANIDINTLNESRKDIELATEYVLERIRLENPNRRIIFVMDADRNGIYEDKVNESVLFLNKLMQKNCEKFAFELLDLSSSMKRSFQINQKKFNSEFDSHWDEYGHNFVYQQVVTML